MGKRVAWVLAASTLAANLLGMAPGLWMAQAVAVVVMLLSAWAVIALLATARLSVWEAWATGGSIVLGWLTVSGMLTHLLPGGLTTINTVASASVLSVWLVVFQLQQGEPLRARPTTGSRRVNVPAWTGALLSLAVLGAALTVNHQAERQWLTARGPALFAEGSPPAAVVLVNRDEVVKQYRLVVTNSAGIQQSETTLAPGARFELSTSVTGAHGVRVEVFDEHALDAGPVVFLTLAAAQGSDAS